MHVGLSDFANNRYLYSERVYRSGWQIHCSEAQLDIEIGAVSAKQTSENSSFAGAPLCQSDVFAPTLSAGEAFSKFWRAWLESQGTRSVFG